MENEIKDENQVSNIGEATNPESTVSDVNLVEETSVEPEVQSSDVENEVAPEEPVVEPIVEAAPVVESEFEDTVKSTDEKPKKKGSPIVFILLFVVIVCAIVAAIFLWPKNEKTVVIESGVNLDYKLSSNKLEAFDLYFLKLANEKDSGKNIIYSPLSIKNALGMVEVGANGKTKKQLTDILGEYKSTKYTNSQNMSFANALFANDNVDKIKTDTYGKEIEDLYGAVIKYDAFKDSTNINNWIKERTLGLIDNAVDSVNTSTPFVLVNALAIDMEWVNRIQSLREGHGYIYSYEKDANLYVAALENSDYHELEFNKTISNAKSVLIGASANRYDIVNALGEEKIKDTLKQQLNKYKSDCDKKENAYYEACVYKERFADSADFDKFVEEYITELKSYNGKFGTSTDFGFYVNDDVKVFAKDLKTYDGITLEYIGVMPKSDLNSYVKDLTADKLNGVIDKIKVSAIESYEEGKLTKLSGYIPLFSYDYQLDLKSNLQSLGVTDMFDVSKADLTGITPVKNTYIKDANHKATIEFSNDGIKAAATTTLGGEGGGGDIFYQFEVPIVEIDLTFDKPFLYLIRNKETGEVWFTGIVNQPLTYTSR